MCEENSDGAIFKILPRYKVRSEGDSVSNANSTLFNIAIAALSYFLTSHK